jgi:ADP-dependent NAD(P)H-hydrate dehydratase / NAD(P)H-hydrate epimerase
MTHHTPMPDPKRDVFGRADVLLPTAAEAAAADHAAGTAFGVPERVLMETAGRAAAMVLDRLHPSGIVAGVAGSGNNGGDLLVMLRVLREWGRDVTVAAVGTSTPDSILAHGTDMKVLIDDDAAAFALARADVIVDGMLGTGSAGAPRGRIAEWIDRINASGRPVLALDLPSGVDATTGVVPGEAVRATTTVTFGWPKLGLLLHPARHHCGRLVGVEIGFPSQSVEASARAITPDWARLALRRREPVAHKGSAGRLFVLAGSSGMAGAAALAVEAAIRAGGGLLRVASCADNRVILQTVVPEATFLDRDHLAGEDLDPMHAMVAGPGLGTDASARHALLRSLELTPGKPTLIDADGLNIIATGEAGSLAGIAADRALVITPHARELSRLSGTALDDILADPVAAARSAAAAFGCTVLLKGQPSLVAAPDGALLVNTVGSSDVAAAGTGDQLAGTIGALLAGGMPPAAAAALGLFLSGRAADLAALGSSLSPRDVSDRLADAMVSPGPARSDLTLPFITFDQPPRW